MDLELSEDNFSTLLEVRKEDCNGGAVTRVFDLVEEDSKERRTYEWNFVRIGDALIPGSHKVIHKKEYKTMKEASDVVKKLDKTLERKQYRGNSLSNRLFAAARIGMWKVRT